jgi:3D (Asp-Asp-Asp) domain-containing protein
MKKWQLVSTGLLISTLLVSNVIITYQYKVESKSYQKQISIQNKLIKQNSIKFNEALFKQQNIINDLNKTIKEKSSDIDNLQQQLQKATTRNESPMRQLNMTITAYTSNCRGCSGLTYTEHNVRNTIYYQGYRVVAADLRVIPLYSIIEIKTQSQTIKGIVIDKGGVIKGQLLDLLVSSYDDAINFGRLGATVKILREGKG